MVYEVEIGTGRFSEVRIMSKNFNDPSELWVGHVFEALTKSYGKTILKHS